ncbi:MAG TPA: MFS transporter [Pseudonocardiaceae bacterium]|nr:MFS transporter [Pseudonocardiaceae bacterium]
MNSHTEAGKTGMVEEGAVGRGPWSVFWVLALIEFMSVMDASVVNIALPSIRIGLGFSPTTISWVVDAYLLGFAGFMLLAGRATDLVGRRRLFITGVAVFGVFSLACAAAQAPWELVTSRLLQGLGAALVTPTALALITDIFPEGKDRNKALGMFSGMAGVAAPVGLVLGGLLTTAAWQWIFLINVPVVVVVLIGSGRLLPRTRPTGGGGLDVVGAVSATAGLLLLVLAMERGSAQGWGSAASIAEFTAAGVMLVVFVVRQITSSSPLIPTILLGKQNIAMGNVIFALVGTILISTFFFITLFLQQVRDYGSLHAALVYLPVPLAMLLGTQVAPRLMRFGPHNALMSGLVIQAVALAAWAVWISDTRTIFVAFVVPATVWAFGLGVSIVSSFVVCTMGTTGQMAGAAAGLATTTYQAGGAIGLAILAVIADNRTRGAIAAAGHTGPNALVSGYTLALWCAVGIAVVGALLTRFLGLGSAAPASDAPAEPAVATD